MENNLESVVDDISIIKSVIEKTRRSFSGFSKIFIIWGCMYVVMSLINFVQSMNMDLTRGFYNDYQFLVYLVPLVFFGIGGLVFVNVVKKQPLVGLERHLMVLWVMVIFIQLIHMRVSVYEGLNADGLVMTNITIQTVNLSVVAYALGIALVMTGILTELKQLKHMGIIYTAFAFVHSYLPVLPKGFSYARALDVFGYIIMPFTLIYVGVYLKKQSERG